MYSSIAGNSVFLKIISIKYTIVYITVLKKSINVKWAILYGLQKKSHRGETTWRIYFVYDKFIIFAPRTLVVNSWFLAINCADHSAEYQFLYIMLSRYRVTSCSVSQIVIRAYIEDFYPKPITHLPLFGLTTALAFIHAYIFMLLCIPTIISYTYHISLQL